MGDDTLRAQRLLATISALGLSLGIAFEASASTPSDAAGAQEAGAPAPTAESRVAKQKAWLTSNFKTAAPPPEAATEQADAATIGGAKGTHIKKAILARPAGEAPPAAAGPDHPAGAPPIVAGTHIKKVQLDRAAEPDSVGAAGAAGKEAPQLKGSITQKGASPR